jgi:hypothetical protein
MSRRVASTLLLLLTLTPAGVALAEEKPRRAVTPAAVEHGGFLAALDDVFARWRSFLEKGGGSMDPDGKPRQEESGGSDGGGTMDPDG